MIEPASVCGRRAEEVERRAERERLANRSRSATTAADPQTEARRGCGRCEIGARDERAVCVVERVRPRGGQGRPDIPWSAAKPCVGHGGRGNG